MRMHELRVSLILLFNFCLSFEVAIDSIIVRIKIHNKKTRPIVVIFKNAVLGFL